LAEVVFLAGVALAAGRLAAVGSATGVEAAAGVGSSATPAGGGGALTGVALGGRALRGVALRAGWALSSVPSAGVDFARGAGLGRADGANGSPGAPALDGGVGRSSALGGWKVTAGAGLAARPVACSPESSV
jgi:hypothetical protein